MTTYQILQATQPAVCSATHDAVKKLLPLSANEVWLVAKIYGIQTTFYGPRDRIYRGQNVDMNRWTCRKDNQDMVTSITLD